MDKEIRNEQELVTMLRRELDDSNKQNVKILAGHLPLIYNNEEGNKSVGLNTKKWGEFSKYSFDIGCRLLRYSLDLGKEGKLILVVDDDVELPKYEKEINGEIKEVRRDYNWGAKVRKRFFKKGEIPIDYKRTLENNNLTLENLAKQKRDEVKTPLISERKLKQNALNCKYAASNECSLAYKGMIHDSELFNNANDLLISFIPGQCKGNICEGVLQKVKGLDAIHIFFPHIEQMGGFIQGESSFSVEPMKLSEMYKNGMISLRRDY